jgi:RHS repeat-associated protein
MKRIIIPFIALLATLGLSILDTKAQNEIYMADPVDYVPKSGKTHMTSISYEGPTNPNLEVSQVNILEGNFVDIEASVVYQYGVQELVLEIAPAIDFGEMLYSHVQITFNTNTDNWYELEFWMNQPGLDLGSISPSSQNILYEYTPQTLTYSSSDHSSIRFVEWQRKVGSGNWTDIPGATGYSYAPGSLSQTTEFRCLVTSLGYDEEYTSPVIVNVSSEFVPGAISGDQTIIPGYPPRLIVNSTSASGGAGPISYQWQSSLNATTPDPTNWTNIAGATSATYQPPALSVKTYYRRKATSGTQTVFSNTVTILMKSLLPEYLSFEPVANVVSNADKDTRTQGLKTFERIAILDGAGTDGFIERAFYYDYKGRVIQTVEKNRLGGVSRYSTKYDFVGNVLASHESHQTDDEATPDVKLTEFDYDHRGRLLSETTTLNGGTPAVVTYEYDELGKLATTTYGTGAGAVTETNEYNVQGWLTERSSSLFEMTLRYHDPVKSTSTPSYTGNIAEWEWAHTGSGADGTVNTYSFAYDPLSRLTDTRRFVGTSTTPTNSFTERNLTYDKNGNILTLERYGTSATTAVDDFAYEYEGNRLSTLNTADNSSGYSYSYDANGNMTTDGLNSLDFNYNYLNLLGEVRDSSDDLVAKYTFLADGTKAGVVNGEGDFGLEYLGSLVYQRNSSDEITLESAAFGGGRILVSDTGTGYSYTPNYFLTDHLGSVRATVNQNGVRTSMNNYYPYGLMWSNSGAQISGNRYLYNGKELQSVGMPAEAYVLDYGWRMGDSRLGRWPTQDRKLEKYYSISPYVFTLNNPIKNVDPNGLDVWEFDETGKIVNHIKDDTQDAFYRVNQVDGEWQRSGDGLVFDYGTVTDTKTTDITIEGGETKTLTMFAIEGGDNATKLFEFMAKPETTPNVEWEHVKTPSDQNIVGTMHTEGSSAVQGYLNRQGVTIKEAIHNHPRGTTTPSPADIRSGETIRDKSPNATFTIYVHPNQYYNYNNYLQPLVPNIEAITITPAK